MEKLPCILIADDEIETLNAVTEYLDTNYDILQATHREEAWDIFCAEAKDIDLVITDWHMDATDDGIMLVKDIRQHPNYNDIPIIMFSRNSSVSDLKEAFEAGVNDYVRKDIPKDNKEELLARVKAAVELSQLRKQLKQERDLLERLLYSTFPSKVADKLKMKGKVSTQYYNKVSILFTDFVGFTAISSKMPASKLMKELDDCFSSFDRIIQKYGLERIKTIGDAYMCAGGVPAANRTNPIDIILAAFEMQNFMKARFEEKKGDYWQCRLGISTGGVVAGIVGETRLAYDIWGDAVNVAARMESNGEVYKVNISRETYDLVKDFFVCEQRPDIEIKGKGVMETFFVLRIKPELSQNGEGLVPNDRFWQLREEKFGENPIPIIHLSPVA